MSKELISHTFNSIIIAQRQQDGYINLTAMCKACGKQLGHYLENASTKAFLTALSRDTGISINLLVQTVRDPFRGIYGSFGHPYVADNLREWLNRGASRNIERTICQRLQAELGGKIEVDTPAGKIDLLTPLEMIEVKALKSWKTAIGQAIVYGSYYPRHQKRIHLFGKAGYSVLEVIDEHCERLEITLTLEFVKEEPHQ